MIGVTMKILALLEGGSNHGKYFKSYFYITKWIKWSMYIKEDSLDEKQNISNIRLEKKIIHAVIRFSVTKFITYNF